jgi:hypothetical protein
VDAHLIRRTNTFVCETAFLDEISTTTTNATKANNRDDDETSQPSISHLNFARGTTTVSLGSCHFN